MGLFSGEGGSGFSASSTAEEVTHGIDASALTAIVTGESSGIGKETARVLALRGVHVVMGVRNMSAGKDVKEAILKQIPTAKVDALELDLSSIASVRTFASNFNSLALPLNILINNAGVMATPFTLTRDSIELQFATNHVGEMHYMPYHFLKYIKINGKIILGQTREESEKIFLGRRGYNSFSAYGQSKLANVLHANELARRLKEERAEITANSLHPGAIMTNLFRHNSFINGLVDMFGRCVLKNVEQGAATTCCGALHPQVEGKSGKYFADSNLAQACSQANDPELAKKLWEFTSCLIS